MKYIPLTEHLTTVAMLYEQYAGLSSQIDELQKKIQTSPQDQEQSSIVQTTVNPPELRSPKNKPEAEIIIEEQKQSKKSSVGKQKEKKQKSVKKPRKLVKKIEKAIVATNSFYCDHCGKTYETRRKFRKHQYGLEYRNKTANKQNPQKEKSQEQEKGKKGSNLNDQLYVSI